MVQKFQTLLGGRAGLAAKIFTLILLALVHHSNNFARRKSGGRHSVRGCQIQGWITAHPTPPLSVSSRPLIGGPLSNIWKLASTDLSELARQFAPQLRAALPGILSASAGVTFTVLQLLLSIVIAGAILAKAESAYESTRLFASRLFGKRGPEFQHLVGATIRSVTFGIVGVALIQSVFAALGFYVVRLPGAGVWSTVFLVAAVLQVGMIVLIPAVIYVFASANSTTAVIFLIWCLIVGLMDNVLKPLLLGRGAAVPVAIVFLGAIGGFMAMGIIGLFVGAIVLSVGYKLFLAWLGEMETNAVTA